MFRRLGEAHPGARLEWQALDFPLEGRSPIHDVDVGLILEPPERPDLSTLILEYDRRVALMAATHPLAWRQDLTVEDLLGETWPGTHPSMDRTWRGFWSFDEVRGGPPKQTDDRIMSAEEGTEVVASGRAIATTPAAVAAAFPHAGLIAVPIVDAGPASLALVWRTDNENPLVDALVTIARSMADGHAVPATKSLP